MMNTAEIFEGITTAELLAYKVGGDNSKELAAELMRRASNQPKRTSSSNIESDAKFNGYSRVRL